MMQAFKAMSLTKNVNAWLAETRHPRILHVFDKACNLINEHKEVLSIVTPQIGNGPFNLVIEDDNNFTDHLNVQSEISITVDQLHLGEWIINFTDAKPWSPRPDWDLLYMERSGIFDQLTSSSLVDSKPAIPASLFSTFTTSIVTTDIQSSITAVSKLAGLGQGLTPAGDDIIMGAIYAAWIIHPLEVVSVAAKEITDTAAPLTTSLSAAWLRSAGKGEAGILWHLLFDALINDESNIQLQVNKILDVGETSGADAMAGFLGVMQSYIASLSRNEETSSDE